MDTHLIALLATLGIRNDDAKIIKNAGGVISYPFGSAMRSLCIAIYALGIEDIMVIGHTDCGVQHMNATKMITSNARKRSIVRNYCYYALWWNRF